MRKTLVILSTTGLDYLDVALLKQKAQHQFILLCDAQQAAALPDEIKSCFADIIVVASQLQNTPTPMLDEQAVFCALARFSYGHVAGQLYFTTFAEMSLSLVAKLNAHFGTPGVQPETLAPYRNKHVMKETLVPHGIRCPRSELFNPQRYDEFPENYFTCLSQVYGVPFIVKPTDSAGSLGVIEIESLADFMRIRDNPEYGSLPLEINEYVTGRFFHCDSWIVGDDITCAIVSEYTYPNLEFLRGKPLGSMVLPMDDPLTQRIQKQAATILHILGLIEGATHMELFLTHQDALVFLEVAARPPGGMILKMLNQVFHTNFANYTLDIIMGEAKPLTLAHVCYAFWAVFPNKQGTVKALGSVELSSYYTLQWLVEVGMKLAHPKSIAEKAGTLFAHHANLDVIQQDFEAIRHVDLVELTHD